MRNRVSPASDVTMTVEDQIDSKVVDRWPKPSRRSFVVLRADRVVGGAVEYRGAVKSVPEATSPSNNSAAGSHYTMRISKKPPDVLGHRTDVRSLGP